MHEDILFQSVPIGSRLSANRFWANPIEHNNANPDGSPSNETMDIYETLARGSWGVVVVESTTASTHLSHRGFGEHGLMLNKGTVDGFKILVDRFKSVDSEALLIIQVSTGMFGLAEDYIKLSTDEILSAKKAMVIASVLAAEAGFDGVDFKQCHDILTCRLLSRLNMREDKWGGNNLDERSDFFKEAIEEIRERVQKQYEEEFIIGTRISEADVSYLREMIHLLETDTKVDFINVSLNPPPYMFDANVLLPLSQTVKMMDVEAPIVCSGGTDATTENRSLARVIDLLHRPLAPDFIGFGRQSLADPLFPGKIKDGNEEAVQWCKKCGGCGEQLFEQTSVSCRMYSNSKDTEA